MANLNSLFLHNGFLRPFSGKIRRFTLTANTNKSVTVPTGANYVVIASNADLYVKNGGTATMPTGSDETDDSASELNPAGYWLVDDSGAAVTSIGIISASAAVVTMAFYKAVQ